MALSLRSINICGPVLKKVSQGETVMKAGRELDALIAEKVMGFASVDVNGMKLISNPGLKEKEYFVLGPEVSPYPPYSTDIAAAWGVVSKLNRQFYVGNDAGIWTAEFEVAAHSAIGETAPHAICLAALKAVGTK